MLLNVLASMGLDRSNAAGWACRLLEGCPGGKP
jgi:hypothetical protein